MTPTAKELHPFRYMFRWITMQLNLWLHLKPRAYCRSCFHEYTFEEWDTLQKEKTYLQYKATQTICLECRNKETWWWVG